MPAHFDDIWMNSPFAVKYNVSGSVICNSKTFNGKDPLPGKAKQCFCDDIEYNTKEMVESELKFFE